MLEDEQKEVYGTYQDGRTWVKRHPTLTVLFAVAAIAAVIFIAIVT